MKDFDRWIKRYCNKFHQFRKIVRQFNNEKYILRFYDEGGSKILGISILDDGEEWDYGIFDCSQENDEDFDMMTFEDFEEESKMWDAIKNYVQ